MVLDASKLGGTLFPLLAVALSLNLVLTEHQAPGQVVEMMRGITHSPLVFMLLVNGLLLIIGCLMTTGEAILILGPLLAPLAAAYGHDKMMFGIIMIVNLEIGFLTPPVGLNLLVAMSTFNRKFGELVIAAAPFIVLMLGCLALVAWQPLISMALVRCTSSCTCRSCGSRQTQCQRGHATAHGQQLQRAQRLTVDQRARQHGHHRHQQ